MKLKDKFIEYLGTNEFAGDFTDDANYLTRRSIREIAHDLAQIACSGDECPVMAQLQSKFKADKDKIKDILLKYNIETTSDYCLMLEDLATEIIKELEK